VQVQVEKEESMLRCVTALGIGVLGFVCGCGPKVDANLPTRVPAKVTVTYKGAPVADAHVSFMPTASGAKSAFGTTDAQGVAKLSTLGGDDGAVPGEYNVAVRKTKIEGPQTPVDPNNPNAAPADPTKIQTKTVDLVPGKYSSPANSGLKASVTKDGKNEFTFDLTD
jgi:hypothetical protein